MKKKKSSKSYKTCMHAIDWNTYQLGVIVDSGCPNKTRIHGIPVVPRNRCENCPYYETKAVKAG